MSYLDEKKTLSIYLNKIQKNSLNSVHSSKIKNVGNKQPFQKHFSPISLLQNMQLQ